MSDCGRNDLGGNGAVLCFFLLFLFYFYRNLKTSTPWRNAQVLAKPVS